MAKFAYVAVDASGKEVKGTIEAGSQALAVAKIRESKLFPTAIGEVKDAAAKGATAPGSAGGAKKSAMSMEIKLPKLFRGKVKPKDLMVMTRQLATLVDAGLPLLRGLRVLQKQCTNPALKESLAGMCESVESGSTFSDSLTNYPKIFNNLFVNMVRAGEAGGVLEVVLNRLAEFMEKAEKIKNKVKSAMIYPVVVLFAAVGILAFLLTSVIPKFEEIFKDLLNGKSLPMITQIVINASNMAKNHGLVLVVIVVGAVFLFKMWAVTKAGRYMLDYLAMKVPVFGTLTVRSGIARLTRTLGTLLSSGVPILQALTIVRDTSGNQVISKAVQSIHDSVKEGEGMTAPMAASGVFPPMVVSMVEVGEETGALADMLIRIADTYDDEVDNAVAGLTSIIEPVMIIFLAGIVGTIVVAMFLPLINIIGSLSAQAG